MCIFLFKKDYLQCFMQLYGQFTKVLKVFFSDNFIVPRKYKPKLQVQKTVC